MIWDFLYLSNFYDTIFLAGKGNQYWSLAVEEQFYLVWPFFILLCPRRYLRASLIDLIIGVIGLRLFLASDGAEQLLVKKFSVFCMDSLGIGALVALTMQHYQTHFDAYSKRVGWGLLVIGVGFSTIAMTDIWFDARIGSNFVGFLHAGLALIGGALLIGAIKGYKGILGAVLTWKPLCYLGTISYGCYLFHLAVHSWLEGLTFFQLDYGWGWAFIGFWVKVLLTVLAATVSWYTFERPINSFKDWFPMNKARLVHHREKIALKICRIRRTIIGKNC